MLFFRGLVVGVSSSSSVLTDEESCLVRVDSDSILSLPIGEFLA